MFKLKVGDVCKLNEVIPGIYKSGDWKTGLYRVKMIWAPFCYGRDREDPRRQSYSFEKIKKDGTVYKSFSNGYRCQAWDKFIDEGKVEIVRGKKSAHARETELINKHQPPLNTFGVKE